MRFKRQIKLEKEHMVEMDIAPLIDVIFQLLIFFMLTSTFVLQPGIKINLPKAVTSEGIGERRLTITVTGENIMYINEKISTLEELKRYLAEQKKDKPVLIKADRKASLGRVVEIWDICRESGVSQVNIATTQDIK